MVYKRLITTSKCVSRSQQDILFQIISRNVNTEYGKDHHFSSIQNFSDRKEFCATHFLTDYSDYSEYLERIANGEVSVLELYNLS